MSLPLCGPVCATTYEEHNDWAWPGGRHHDPERTWNDHGGVRGGGGLTAAGRARRENVRLQAAGMFEQDVSPVQVAHRLRVSTKSACQWRRRWRAGGLAALVFKGPGGTVCRLDDRQVARLRAALDGGPAAWGWDQDQRWTLARVTTLIARLCHVRYTLRGTSY